MPTVERGGVWSHNMLWLEPVTSCVNTNLTIDYKFTNNAITTSIDNYNLTDRGGLVNLTTEYPFYIPCTSTQEVESKLNIIKLPGGMRSKEVEREAMVVYDALHAEHHE